MNGLYGSRLVGQRVPRVRANIQSISLKLISSRSLVRTAAKSSQSAEQRKANSYCTSESDSPMLATDILKAVPRGQKSFKGPNNINNKSKSTSVTDKIFLNALQKPRVKFATAKTMLPTNSSTSAASKQMSFAGVLGSVLASSKKSVKVELTKDQQVEQDYKQFLSHKSAIADINGMAGRSFDVNSPAMLGAALGKLNRTLRQNKVREQIFSYRVYERPCHRRQRLKKDAQNQKFKEGFKRMLSLVNMARAQGY